MPTAHVPKMLACLALIASAVLIAPPAWAGCGCDHPPPAEATVMPPFASPGTTIRLYAEGRSFRVNESYTVQFGSKKNSVQVAAENSSYVEATVPPGVAPGPLKIKVTGKRFRHTYSSALFTALDLPRVVPPGSAVNFVSIDAAIAEDGTLLIPLDLTDVLDPTQLAVRFEDLALTFGLDDVVFYNADGFDLTLFTLDVTNTIERQWGSYYGWDVEDDTGLIGTVYDAKVHGSNAPSISSDLLTYWRHEFYTYAAAHAPGGTHETDPTGFFHLSDGTRHVDHYQLVIAISGLLRDPSNPLDPDLWEPLRPGKMSVTAAVATLVSETPIEPEVMAAMIDAAVDQQGGGSSTGGKGKGGK